MQDRFTIKRRSRAAIGLLLVMPLLAGGCDRYRITLNERVVSEPPRLISGVEVADSGLKGCIEQTVKDRQITTTDQLHTLVCTHAGITDVDGIQVFSSLRILNLANNALTSVSPLLFLGNLQSLNLNKNPQLHCPDLEALKAHLPADGALIAPTHCED